MSVVVLVFPVALCARQRTIYEEEDQGSSMFVEVIINSRAFLPKILKSSKGDVVFSCGTFASSSTTCKFSLSECHLSCWLEVGST